MAFLEQVEASDTAGTSATLGLQYGDSKTLAATLAKILKSRDEEYAKKGRPTVSLVLADERTNSLLIYGDPEAIGMARDAVGSLDIPTPKGKGDVHLISLSNAKAEDLAQVINTLVERQRAAGTEDQKPDTVLSKDIKVVADKSTNSLVVTARPDEFEALSNIVAKLDVVRKQVFIEALIMEVSSEASFSFGINWAIGGNTGDAAIVGGVSLNGGAVSLSSSGATKTVSLPAGVSIGAILKDAITVGNTSYNIQSILNAVRGNSDVDVLATPQLLTLDNEEASVEVVDNIPFTKESTTRNDNDFTTQSMDYKDVGVKLKITPRISDALRWSRKSAGSRRASSPSPTATSSSPRPPASAWSRPPSCCRTARRRSSAACSTIRRPTIRAKSPGSAASPCSAGCSNPATRSRPRPTCSSSSRPRSSETRPTPPTLPAKNSSYCMKRVWAMTASACRS